MSFPRRLLAFSCCAGLAVCAVATVPAHGAGGASLTGTVHAGRHPEPRAVIWLDAPGAPRLSDPRKIVLDQRNLSFNPEVLVVRVGTSVEFPNRDRVFHNVFSFHDGKKFDLGLYPIGAVRRVTFDKPGLSRIFCNIHPNMAAYVMAVDTPYYAAPDDVGRFSIGPVPPGTYTYHAWRPGSAEVSGTVSLPAERPLEIAWP